MPENWFDSAYQGTPPWDIGHPQPEIVRLDRSGQITGSVLDVGCGTGEHVLYLAGRGFEVMGVDSAPTAIKKARAKAKRRGLDVTFVLGDALNLSIPKHRFDTVIDMGLFHVFSDEERPRFRESLERVLRPGGTYFMMCFSEKEPGGWGPRRVTQAEIRSVFKDSWRANYIESSTIETISGQAEAWLASLTFGQ
jgi:cyclopropane fatty-acyl-phospholipid synthase-like methyltransferase